MNVIYDNGLGIRIVDEDNVPEVKEKSILIGGFLSGCRIGVDLEAGDYKLFALIDGEVVFTTEIPWIQVSRTIRPITFGT